jgi:hypothetical protein
LIYVPNTIQNRANFVNACHYQQSFDLALLFGRIFCSTKNRAFAELSNCRFEELLVELAQQTPEAKPQRGFATPSNPLRGSRTPFGCGSKINVHRFSFMECLAAKSKSRISFCDPARTGEKLALRMARPRSRRLCCAIHFEKLLVLRSNSGFGKIEEGDFSRKPASRAPVGGCPRPAFGPRKTGFAARLAPQPVHTCHFLEKSSEKIVRFPIHSRQKYRKMPNLRLQADPPSAPHPQPFFAGIQRRGKKAGLAAN